MKLYHDLAEYYFVIEKGNRNINDIRISLHNPTKNFCN